MGVRLEDLRALLTMIVVFFAAYLPFYIGIIKYYIPEQTFGYYLLIECVQAVGGIAISIYFSVRRAEGKRKLVHKREPLNLPKNGIRVILLCNSVISIILGISYYISTYDTEMLNLPFVISMIVGLIAWLWPVQVEEEVSQKAGIVDRKDKATKLKHWE